MTLPSTDTIQTYGGVFIDASPVENPLTDQASAQFNQLSASVAMSTHTVIRGWVQFTGNATTPVLVAHDSLWGNSAPVTPTVSRVGAGQYRIVWPTSVNDELGVAHTLNVRGGFCNVQTASGASNANFQKDTSNSTQIFCSASNVASDLVGVNIDVFFI
jgi:hypothetical protein